MSNFEKVQVKNKIVSSDRTITVEIVKYKKTGTSRTFFRPEFEGNPVSRKLWARMYDAESQARAFIEHKQKQAQA